MRNVTRMMQMLFAVMLMAFVFATQGMAQSTLMTESFDGGNGTTPPSGWATEQVSGTAGSITFVTGGTYPTTTPYDGTRFVEFNSFSASTGNSTRLKRTTAISTVGYTNVAIDFAWYEDPGYSGSLDRVDVQWSTNGTTWTTAGTFNRYNSVAGWKSKAVTLPAGAQGQATLYVAFTFISAWGNNCHLDLAHVTAVGPPPPATVTIGTGTSTVSYPYLTYWHDGRTQLLYTAAEIIAAGGSPGQISTIAFDVSSYASQTMNGFNVRLQNTTSTGITGFVTSGWNTVYTGTYAVPGTGWQTITLQTPFIWDGSNLLLEICFDNTSYTSYSYVRGTSVAANMVRYYYTDGSAGCSFTSTYTSSTRPNLRFVVQPYVGTLTGTVTNNYNGTPISGATISVTGLTPVSTNASGVYTLYNVPIGDKSVTATMAGFTPQTKQATIQNQQTTTVDFALDPIPGVLSGVITNASTGAPVVGAMVQVNPPSGPSTLSTAGGNYTLNVYPVGGPWNAVAGKAGFDNLSAGPFTFTQGNTITQDFALLENTNAPTNVVAALNTGATAVDVTWGLPNGNYEQIFDDGIAENFTVWATAGNRNAVKFTPVGYPATVLGGKVNIGTVNNYPSGANPLVPFQIAIYDATGPGGTPGIAIDTFDVTPGTYGWVNFNFSSPVTITSGSFYLVMIQGGNAPDAAGIAVDETAPQLRSYASFNNGPWIPAGGNFMMRALMNGSGGPLLLDASAATITGSPAEGAIYANTPATVTGPEGTGTVVWVGDNGDVITGYQVFRLKQGEEGTPGVWTSIGTPTTTNITDNSWPSLACGPYLWAVEAIFTGNRFSGRAFSNVIGKCWTAEVTVNVTLTCAANPKAGTIVKLVNNVYPDTMYVGVTDTAGTVVFPAVWKGNYTLSGLRFTYPLYTQVVDIMGDMTIDIMMLQDKTPPTNLFVDDRSLESVWNSPRVNVQLFGETWASGNFTANQWVVTGGNWGMATGFGNPAPSAQFNWSPQITNYNQYLTSKNFTGIYSPQQLLKYDIYLSNFSTTNENTLAVELWDGATWHVLKTYTNMNGNINWTSETLDISAYNDITFKIRFHTAGADSYDINNWNLDNIYVLAGDGSTGYNPCVLGYNFYLNNVLTAFTTDTTYLIPANLVQYGTTYNACVNAIYGSGYSNQTCYTFTSHFLYPPRNLEVEGVECNAYLTWEKPAMVADLLVTDVQPRTSWPVASAEYSPMDVTLANVDYTDAMWDVLFSWNGTDGARPGIEADNDYVYLSAWQSGFGAPPWFQKYNKTTGVLVEGFDIPGATAVRDMASDGQYFYGSAASSSLYKMDFASHTLVGTISTGVSGGIRHLAYDPNLDGGNGGFWAGNWTDMRAISMTGTVLGNGPAMNSAYGSAFDDQSAGGPYLWVFTQTGSSLQEINQYTINYSPLGLTPTGVIFNVGGVPGASGGTAGGLCSTPVATKFALVSNTQLDPQFIAGLEIADYSGPGGTPAGLIGYNVYRDGAFIAYVSGVDTTWYYDLNLDPDTYEYAVTAKYDLTDYGFPGQFDESLIEGPQSVDILCGRPLPFYEPWDQSSFSYNDWTFGATQGNWTMNSGLGNPAPTADFSWQPMVYDYSYALESPVLNAGPWTCASLWFDFDYKLADRNATGAEKLSVEVFYNGTWHQKAEYANNGSVDWTSEHFDISSAQGKALKVRFVAFGAASEDILHWYVDNIHVYGICNSPVDLTGSVAGNNVTLTWTPPTCEGGGGGGTVMQFIFDDGSAENGWAINPGYTSWIGNEFPIASTYQGVLQSFDVWFGFGSGSSEQLVIDVFDGTQTLVGTSDAFLTPSEDWLTVLCNDIPFSGMFYAMVKWDMLGSATNYFGIDEDGPYAADDLEWYYDGSTWDKFSNMGYNGGVMLIRATALVSGDLKSVELVAGKKPVAHAANNGALSLFNGYFDTKNYATMGPVDNETDSSQIIGYNVYRTDVGATPPYTKLNAAPVTATTYLDVIPNTVANYGNYKYYVTSLFNDSQANTFLCESPGSDTLQISFPAVGVNELGSESIVVYPNPATDVVNVKSDATISTIEVMNFVGQSVFTMNTVDSKTAKINVTSLRAGVYFVKVTTSEGIRTTKITVTR